MANKATGFGAGALGVSMLVGLLIGQTATTATNYWCKPGIIAALGISAVLIGVGGWALGSVYLDWPWPKTHAERKAEREEREQEERIAALNRGHALDELLHELHAIKRDAVLQLEHGRVWGVMHSGTAWNKTRHYLAADAQTDALVGSVYARAFAMNRMTQQRYDAASQTDVNDPEWLKLTDEEERAIRPLLGDVDRAIGAVRSLRERERGLT